MVTLRDAWEYVGFFDEPDPVTQRTISRTLNAAQSFAEGAIGSGFDDSDPRAEQYILLAFGFLYDSRDLVGKGSGNFNQMANSLRMQLRLQWEADHENG